jgi:hypothetical protein
LKEVKNMEKRIFLKISHVLLLLLALALPTIARADWFAMESGTTYELRGVWGSSGADVFVVGIGGVILHYDGNAEGSWSPMQNSSP